MTGLDNGPNQPRWFCPGCHQISTRKPDLNVIVRLTEDGETRTERWRVCSEKCRDRVSETYPLAPREDDDE